MPKPARETRPTRPERISKMKKAILIMLVVILCVSLAQAKSRLGLRGGVNVSSLKFTDNLTGLDTSASLGLHAGVFVQFNLADTTFAIQPELLYSQKGSLSDTDAARIDYIVFPLLLKGNVNLLGLQAQPLIGPELGYVVSASTDTNPDFLDSINRMNFGVNLGVDILQSENLFFGLRYFLGLSKLDKSSAKREPISNTCWSISTGYLF